MILNMRLKEIKGKFFDASKVQNKADRATLRVLAKFGSFTRRRAKSSIRKRKRVSDPGSPPSSHTNLIRDNIFFVVEPAQKNVVIGPIKINKPVPMVLEALEHGGESLILAKFGPNKGRLIPITIEPRPFMAPAFDEEVKKAPQLYENQVK